MNLLGLLDVAANRKLHARLIFQGLKISIENRKGSVRKGLDKDGKPWATTLTYDYGYIRMTKGVDGDHVDCFIGPNRSSEKVYVVHTKEPSTGSYDEDKCMLGFDSEVDAKKAFLENYNSPTFFGHMDSMSMATFKTRLKNKGRKIEAWGI